jgi:hypothetical protein
VLPRWGQATGQVALAKGLVALEKRVVARIVAGQIHVVHDTRLPERAR